MNRALERLKNGIFTENPTFVLILGMCPTLAVTTSAINGLGMGLSTTVILMASNLMIAALRKVIPNRMRIPAYIVIVASFVTIVDFLLQAYLPSLSESLGGYIKLIVVNCIILGRAESYASKNPVIPSLFDGLGMGLGFTIGLTSIGIVREILGAGTFFGLTIPLYQPIGIFVLSPGAFLVLAFLIAILNANKLRKNKKGQGGSNDEICRNGDCASCGNASCGGRFYDAEGEFGSVASVMAAKTAQKEVDVTGVRVSKSLRRTEETSSIEEKLREKRKKNMQAKKEQEAALKEVQSNPEVDAEVSELDETPVEETTPESHVEEAAKEESTKEESVKEETVKEELENEESAKDVAAVDEEVSDHE